MPQPFEHINIDSHLSIIDHPCNWVTSVARDIYAGSALKKIVDHPLHYLGELSFGAMVAAVVFKQRLLFKPKTLELLTDEVLAAHAEYSFKTVFGALDEGVAAGVKSQALKNLGKELQKIADIAMRQEKVPTVPVNLVASDPFFTPITHGLFHYDLGVKLGEDLADKPKELILTLAEELLHHKHKHLILCRNADLLGVGYFPNDNQMKQLMRTLHVVIPEDGRITAEMKAADNYIQASMEARANQRLPDDLSEQLTALEESFQPRNIAAAESNQYLIGSLRRSMDYLSQTDMLHRFELILFKDMIRTNNTIAWQYKFGDPVIPESIKDALHDDAALSKELLHLVSDRYKSLMSDPSFMKEAEKKYRSQFHESAADAMLKRLMHIIESRNVQE